MSKEFEEWWKDNYGEWSIPTPVREAFLAGQQSGMEQAAVIAEEWCETFEKHAGGYCEDRIRNAMTGGSDEV